jgi:D-alanyl-D-alanine carboxypeptidase (penicillin-binding protein 5/6)
MYGTVLSVLLMGLLPVMDAPLASDVPLDTLPIASPSPLDAGTPGVSALGQSVTASGVLVLDLQSGQLLYGRGQSARRAMGSLTKLMTAIIIAENHSLDEQVTVTREATAVEGSKAHLVAGQTYSVGDMLTALLLPSGNDAATALALFHSGSVAAFVQEMNMRARELGLKNTAFINPTGLDGTGQWSTPQDLAWLASFDWRIPAIRERMSMPDAVITSASGRTIALSHTHELMHQQSPVVAGKTGTTDGAGQCLLSVVEEGDRQYLVVLLGSHERYVDMRALLRTLGSFSL